MRQNVEEGEDTVAALTSSVESDDEAKSVSSGGRTTTCEGKISFSDANLLQAIATCVTSSSHYSGTSNQDCTLDGDTSVTFFPICHIHLTNRGNCPIVC